MKLDGSKGALTGGRARRERTIRGPRTPTLLAALATAVAITGCRPAVWLTMVQPTNRSPRDVDHVKLFFDPNSPDCDAFIVGTMTASPSAGSTANMFLAMRQRAGDAGADGLMQVRIAAQGTVGAGWADAKVYVCK